MNLYNEKIIVAIENAVQQQVGASGVTSELHRLDGEKIVDAIMEQLEGFVFVPREPTEQLLSKAIRKYIEVSDLSIITNRMAHLYDLMIQEAVIEAQEQKG